MTAKLTAALCGFYSDVNTIHKDSKGNFGKYADLATVLSAVNPALAKNGLAIAQTFDIAESGEQLLVTTLLHTSGESISSRLPLTVSKGRNPLHDWGGATTYQRRYALLAILNLAAGIEDDDGDSAAIPPASAPAKPAAKASAKAAAKPSSKPEPAAPAAAPEPQQQAAGDPITEDERQLCVQLLKDMAAGDRNQLIAAFKERFNLAADALITQYITTGEHRDFIQQQLTA